MAADTKRGAGSFRAGCAECETQAHPCGEHLTVAADTKRGAVRAAVLECCRAWEPQARVLGNVTAGELADLLEHVVTAADKAVLDAMARVTIRQDGDGHCTIPGIEWEEPLRTELDRREAAK